MSLPHILLGMLASPASGYDLKLKFSRSAGHFWSAELSQIYPALARLEKDGLLSSEKMPSEKGPDRKVYTRTSGGGEELSNWLLAGPSSRLDRINFLAQVMYLDGVPQQDQIRFMQGLKANFEKRLAALEAVEKNWSSKDPGYPDKLPDAEFFHQATLNLGQRRHAASIDWCEDVLGRLQAREKKGPQKRSP